MTKLSVLFFAFMVLSNLGFSQTREQNVKQLSKYADSLENELIILKREMRDLKSSDPKLYDQKGLIEKQEAQIAKLTKENEVLINSIGRVEGQLKFRSRALENLKQKIKAEGADNLLSTIEIENFKTLPQYAKNCACFYSQDQADYNNRQFLYIEDEKKDCLININGRQERLIYKGGETFSNDNYTLVFENKNIIGNAGTNKTYEAAMVITNKTGDKIIIPVMGVCGCE